MKAMDSKITPLIYGMKAIVFSGVQSPSVFKFTGKEDVVELLSATHSVMLNETRNQEVGL